MARAQREKREREVGACREKREGKLACSQCIGVEASSSLDPIHAYVALMEDPWMGHCIRGKVVHIPIALGVN
jgi:hypothetical protein